MQCYVVVVPLYKKRKKNLVLISISVAKVELCKKVFWISFFFHQVFFFSIFRVSISKTEWVYASIFFHKIGKEDLILGVACNMGISKEEIFKCKQYIKSIYLHRICEMFAICHSFSFLSVTHPSRVFGRTLLHWALYFSFGVAPLVRPLSKSLDFPVYVDVLCVLVWVSYISGFPPLKGEAWNVWYSNHLCTI